MTEVTAMSNVPSRSVVMWWFGTEFVLLVVYQLDGLVAVNYVVLRHGNSRGSTSGKHTSR